MLSILIYLCGIFILAEEVKDLEPTLIEGEQPEEFYPRSVQWPIRNEKLPERTPLPDFADSLNSTGEMQTRFQGSPTISIRGSGQSGRVLALFNNVPLNFSTGFGPPSVLLPRELIQQVSVAKGPTSVFYGSQAMAGSVHFVPQKLKSSELRFSLSDTDDSYLPWRKGSLSQHNFTLITPFKTNPKNFRQISVFTENDDGVFPYEENGAAGVRQDNSNQTNRATLFGEDTFGPLHMAYDFIAANENRISPGPTNIPTRTSQLTRGLLASVAPTYRLTAANLLRSRISYLETKSDYAEPGNDSYFNQNSLILQNEFQQEISRFNVQLFADYFSHQMDNTFFGNNLKEDSFELGTMVNTYLSPIIYLQTGARYLFRNDQLITSVGITHTPYPFKVWLNFSEGFRQATLNDKYANTPFSVANPNLQPEKSKQYELGFQYQPVKQNLTTYKSYFSNEIRFFYIDYSNFFETLQVSATQTQKINAGEGTSQGVDTAWNFNYGPWIFGAKYNYLKTKNKQLNQAFRLSPEQQLSWHIEHYIGAVFLRLQNVIWQKTFDRDLAGNLQPLPDWNQWNLELHTFAFQKINFSVGVINLFDAGKQLTLNYPEPQRRYWAQVRWQF